MSGVLSCMGCPRTEISHEIMPGYPTAYGGDLSYQLHRIAPASPSIT